MGQRPAGDRAAKTTRICVRGATAGRGQRARRPCAHHLPQRQASQCHGCRLFRRARPRLPRGAGQAAAHRRRPFVRLRRPPPGAADAGARLRHARGAGRASHCLGHPSPGWQTGQAVARPHVGLGDDARPPQGRRARHLRGAGDRRRHSGRRSRRAGVVPVRHRLHGWVRADRGRQATDHLCRSRRQWCRREGGGRMLSIVAPAGHRRGRRTGPGRERFCRHLEEGVMARAPGARSRTRSREIPANELELAAVLRDNVELGEGRMFATDTFSGETMLMLRIPRPGVEPPDVPWVPRPTTDVDITHLMEWLLANDYVKVVRERVNHAVDAEGQRNAFSSARQWLLGLPAWDGIVRLDHFFDEVCGAAEAGEGDSEDAVYRSARYLAAIGRCLFISIVARIMQPGCQVDTTPVLEGIEGTNKTKLLRTLAIRREWFSDSFPINLSDKDAMQHLPGTLIVELSEMDQPRSTRTWGAIKNFLTRENDRYRRSYGRRMITQPRQQVFIGTTNEHDYLPEMAGARRFWPLRCGRIDIDKAKAWLEQLYAEALAAYRDS